MGVRTPGPGLTLGEASGTLAKRLHNQCKSCSKAGFFKIQVNARKFMMNKTPNIYIETGSNPPLMCLPNSPSLSPLFGMKDLGLIPCPHILWDDTCSLQVTPVLQELVLTVFYQSPCPGRGVTQSWDCRAPLKPPTHKIPGSMSDPTAGAGPVGAVFFQ